MILSLTEDGDIVGMASCEYLHTGMPHFQHHGLQVFDMWQFSFS
jgi:hypothetical protein